MQDILVAATLSESIPLLIFIEQQRDRYNDMHSCMWYAQANSAVTISD